MKIFRAVAILALLVSGFEACGGGDDAAAGGDGGDASATDASPDGTVTPNDAATSDCPNGEKTTLSGTVFAPNRTLPIAGAIVYVPASPPATLSHGVGASCDPCTLQPSSPAMVQTATDANGHFSLEVSSAANLPVTIEIGKWQRNLRLAAAPTKCADTALPAVDTSLPSSMKDLGGDTESVDMPRIAVSTGTADALECLLRKMGIADSEFSSLAADGGLGSGHVTLFADNGAVGGTGANQFEVGFDGGAGNFADSLTSLWGDAGSLAPFDLVVLSCEGGQFDGTKPQLALDALKSYADHGGRVFMSHWHNIWIGGAFQAGGAQSEADWTPLATWSTNTTTLPDTTVVHIDDTANEGAGLAAWGNFQLDGGAPAFSLTHASGRNTCLSVDGGVTPVAYLDDASSGGATGVQLFEFTTPVTTTSTSRCGEVVFSDIHVSSDSSSNTGTPFPGGCSTNPMSDQERAIAFMLFDIARCGD